MQDPENATDKAIQKLFGIGMHKKLVAKESVETIEVGFVHSHSDVLLPYT